MTLGRRCTTTRGGFSVTKESAKPPPELMEAECLLPNGIVLQVLVHPDDEMHQVKQTVLDKATTEGKVSFGGRLNENRKSFPMQSTFPCVDASTRTPAATS